MAEETEQNPVDALAEKIDEAMRRHAESHASSNSPYQFYCGPECVSQHLRYVVGRELRAAGWASPDEQAAGIAGAVSGTMDGFAEYLRVKADNAEDRVPGTYSDGMRNAATDAGLWPVIADHWREGRLPGTSCTDV